MPIDQSKLERFAENADFAIFEGIQEIVTNLDNLAKAIESSKTESVSVTNLSDAKTDLTPLEANFEALKGSVESVKNAIQSIPKEKEIDFSGIERILKTIADKKVEQIDLSELKNIAKMFDEILYAFQTIASNSGESDKEEKHKQFFDLLNTINDNIVAIEIPDFDYLKFAQIIKDNVKISGGGGPSNVRATIQNGGLDINTATLERQNQYWNPTLNAWEPNQGHTGAQIVMTYPEAVMHGLVPGASSFSSNGHYVAAGAVTDKPILDAGVVNIAPAGGVQLTFVSTDAQDTNITGTGVWTLLMGYIEDSTLLAKTETITMNGLTPVTTVAANIRFVNSLTRLTAGGASVPIGTITAKNGATIYGQMNPGHRVQASSFRMVPAGKTFYPSLIVASSNSGTAAAQAIFHIVQWSPSLPYFTPANAAGCQDASIVIPLTAGRPFTAGTVFGMEVTTDKGSTLTASFIGYLENA